MNTIYSLYKKQPVSKGLVEIINLYDNRYFHMAIDGLIIESLSKESCEATVLKHSFIKKCVKYSGVNENELLFVKIDWIDLGDENIPDYDANDFEEYQQFMDFLNQNPNVKWKNKWGSFIKEIAIGINQLEKNL